MKKTLATIGAIIVVLGGVYIASQFSSTAEYTVPAPQETVEPTPEDSLDEAQRQLDEAKKLLDDEEQKLLEQIRQTEERLEEIRQVRLSFSQAPTPAE